MWHQVICGILWSIFEMFHRPLGWYSSYCAAQLITGISTRKPTITTERTPHSVHSCVSAYNNFRDKLVFLLTILPFFAFPLRWDGGIWGLLRFIAFRLSLVVGRFLICKTKDGGGMLVIYYSRSERVHPNSHRRQDFGDCHLSQLSGHWHSLPFPRLPRLPRPTSSLGFAEACILFWPRWLTNEKRTKVILYVWWIWAS